MSKPFRLGHIADGHSDYRSGRVLTDSFVNVREQDGYNALADCVTDMINMEIDAVVYAGDVFHTPNPSIRAIVEVQEQFRRLAAAGIKIYAGAGNHDASDIKSDIAASKVLDDRFRGIYSHVEPYVSYEMTDGIHVHLVSHHMYSEQNETISKVKPIEGDLNILVTHGSVINPVNHEIMRAGGASPREVLIPEFLLEDNNWSYSMLGHIHERGWVGSKDGYSDTENKKIYYNGSLIRRGFSDKECNLGRGWTLWEIKDDGTFTPEFRNVWQRPQFDFSTIDAGKHTAQEITDIVIENLKKTQTDGNVRVLSEAPILRQKVLNLDSGKQAGLDWRRINSESSHALSWSFQTIWGEDKEAKDKGSITFQELQKTGSPDILTSYDKWTSTSEIISSLSDDIKDKVKEKTRDYLSKSQDKIFSDGLGDEE